MPLSVSREGLRSIGFPWLGLVSIGSVVRQMFISMWSNSFALFGKLQLYEKIEERI